MTQDTVTAAPVSERLRSLTSDSHESAERSEFLVDLLSGKLDARAWYALLEQYRYIYSALEETAGKMRDNDPCFQLLYVELNRFDAIESDLDKLAARIHPTPVGMLASTRDYVDLILATEHDPARYLAHHYVRYLGDLSGGQVMRVWLERHYALEEGETAFFRFAEIPKPVPFKNAYRQGLDELGLSEAEIDRLIDEAIKSFTANEAIFAELQEITEPTAKVA